MFKAAFEFLRYIRAEDRWKTQTCNLDSDTA